MKISKTDKYVIGCLFLVILLIAAWLCASAYFERQTFSSAEYISLKEFRKMSEKYVGKYVRTSGILHEFLGTTVKVWNYRIVAIEYYSYLLVNKSVAVVLHVKFKCHHLLQKWVNVTGKVERLYGKDGQLMGYAINVVEIAELLS
ncbi:MAG: hypothetical protein ACPLRY_04640 [Candidatus Bathyarchaeales archaeon]